MISVLIPVCNESERIQGTIAALRSLPYEFEIVVVDDGSSDDTAQRAEQAGADVVFRQKNMGKGSALATAFRFARGETLLLLDGDIGSSATEAYHLLEPILKGEADMTIALFPVIPGKGGGSGFVVQRAREGIKRLTGQLLQAPLSGQRAMRREVLERCGFAVGWGMEVALTVRALRAGYRTLEIPTQMTHRVTGRDWASRLHRLKQYLSVGRVLRMLESEASTLQKEAPKHG